MGGPHLNWDPVEISRDPIFSQKYRLKTIFENFLISFVDYPRNLFEISEVFLFNRQSDFRKQIELFDIFGGFGDFLKLKREIK